MNSQQERLQNLLNLFLAIKATKQEIEEMFVLLSLDEGNQVLGAVLFQLVDESDDSDESNISIDYETIWKNVLQQGVRQPVSPNKKMGWWHVAVAAVLILLLCCRTFVFMGHQGEKVIVKPNLVHPRQNHSQLGSNIAKFTSVNGSKNYSRQYFLR